MTEKKPTDNEESRHLDIRDHLFVPGLGQSSKPLSLYIEKVSSDHQIGFELEKRVYEPKNNRGICLLYFEFGAFSRHRRHKEWCPIAFVQ